MSGLRAAIVGFGGMGQRHYRAYRAAGIDVAAIVELHRARVAEQLPEFPHAHVFDDYRQMLAAGRVDMVSVVSNGPSHAEIAIAAMEHGVGRVLVEKPVATSLRDADRVQRAADTTGARVAVNHVRRWSTDYRRLKTLIAGGAIGRLRHVTFTSGSTGLGNFVSHAFDTMRWLFEAEPASATAWIDRTGTPNPRGAAFMDPGGFGVVVFDGGQRGFVDASEDTGVQYQFTLVGEIGRVIIDELNGSWTVKSRTDATRGAPFTRYGSETAPVPFDAAEPYDLVTLTRRAIEELAGEGSISCTIADGRRSLEMVVAFHESDARGHAPIAFPLGRDAQERDIPIG